MESKVSKDNGRVRKHGQFVLMEFESTASQETHANPNWIGFIKKKVLSLLLELVSVL